MLAGDCASFIISIITCYHYRSSPSHKWEIPNENRDGGLLVLLFIWYNNNKLYFTRVTLLQINVVIFYYFILLLFLFSPMPEISGMMWFFADMQFYALAKIMHYLYHPIDSRLRLSNNVISINDYYNIDLTYIDNDIQ